jgi:CheY-like chemotaxis protein
VASAADQPSLTILVVEDEWLVRQAIVDYLEAAACTVIEAADGETAVAILQQRDGIAVFTDIRRGRTLYGWDVGEVARETHHDLPVVYASAAAIMPERPVPGSVHLDKPYTPGKVLEACRSLWKARSKQTQHECVLARIPVDHRHVGVLAA